MSKELFVCNYCGKLAGTSRAQHYGTFPEHERRQAAKVSYSEPFPWVPPEKRSREDWKALREHVADRRVA